MRRIFFFLFIITICTPAHAESIRLLTGRVMEGNIIERTDEYIKVNIGELDIPLTYYLDQIESIDSVPVQKEKLNTPETVEAMPIQSPSENLVERIVSKPIETPQKEQRMPKVVQNIFNQVDRDPVKRNIEEYFSAIIKITDELDRLAAQEGVSEQVTQELIESIQKIKDLEPPARCQRLHRMNIDRFEHYLEGYHIMIKTLEEGQDYIAQAEPQIERLGIKIDQIAAQSEIEYQQIIREYDISPQEYPINFQGN